MRQDFGEDYSGRCTRGAKVVFMSGHSEELAGREGGGHDAFIQKPFTPATLAQLTRAVLDRNAKKSKP